MPSRWELHIERWNNCTRCDLHKRRRNVVLAKGEIKSDICFVGEAPGKSEDTLASPFEGPAGHLLDDIIKQSIGLWELRTGRHLRLSYTNLLACIPLVEDKAGDIVKTKRPPDDAVKACSPRLQEFLSIADPKLIICVGRDALDWLTPGFKQSIKLHRPIPMEEITHPGWILQYVLPANQPNEVKRSVVRLRNAVQKHFGETLLTP